MSYSAFKNTVIGRIPCDWAIKKLGEVGRVKMCKRIFKHETSAEGDIPFFKIGTFGQIADAFISREKFESFKSLYPYPRKDTPLISAAGTIGRIVLHDGQDAYYQDSNIVWLEHDEREVLNSYLRYYYSVIKWVTETGSAITRLYNNQLLSALIAVPCIKEQHAIATALSDVDALIEAKTALLEKKRAIKQGAMQELLTGKRRLPGFPVTPMKNTEIGEIPEDWDVKELGSLACMKSGQSITSASIEENGDYPCYGGNGLRGYTRTYTHEGTFPLIGRQGALCGNVTLARGRFYASEHAVVVTLNQGVDAEWMSKILIFMNLNSISEASAQGGLAVSKILKLKAPFPQRAEQCAIAAVLFDLDAEIEALEYELEKLVNLKQGMMQNLLTGRIRLV